jgi:hypothetical protein
MADFCRFVDGFGVFSGEQMVPRRAFAMDKQVINLTANYCSINRLDRI